MSYENPKVGIKFTEKLFFYIARKLYKDSAQALKLKGSEKILEFGSGGGQLTKQMLKHLGLFSSEIFCLDISEYWQSVIKKRLRKYGNIKYRLLNLANCSLDEKDFDLIVVHLAFHHLKDLDKKIVAKQFYHLLKPGGRLFLREPEGSHHNQNVSPDAIKAIILDSGFQLVDEYKKRILIPTFTQIYKK